MLGGMEHLPWIIFRNMKPARRRKMLRRARLWYEHQLTDAEMQVVEMRAALALIDDALADFAANADMLGGKQGGQP